MIGRTNALLFTLFAGFASVCAGEPAGSLAEDGRPNAEILVAEQPKRMAKLAAEELQTYIRKMSGAELPIVTEPGGAEVLVLVGESPRARRHGVDAEGLAHGAFRMVAGDGWLALVGRDVDFEPSRFTPRSREQFAQKQRAWDEKTGCYWRNPTNLVYKHHNKKLGVWLGDEGGSLNAVYAFLRMHGVRWYMPGDLGEVVPEKTSITLPEVNRTVRPDYMGRVQDWSNYARYTRAEAMWGRRLGLNNLTLGGAHGMRSVTGRDEMQRDHPEYYALYGGKRDTAFRGTGHACFSSDGLFRQTVTYCRAVFDDFDWPAVSVMPQDGYHHCGCDLCRDRTPSNLVWEFVDRVARELRKTHPDRLVVGGAYTAYRRPPDSVERFSPNVAVRISWHRAALDDPDNWREYWDVVEGWRKKLAPRRIIRNSNNFFTSGKPVVFPILFTRGVARDMRALKGIGLGERSGVPRAPLDYWRNPGANHLNIYVLSRYLWDAERDLHAMLDEYYRLFYGPAREEMRQAFEFAEASVPRDGRAAPSRVPLADRVRYLEMLHKAREAAGETVYGKRVQLIIDEMQPLEEVRRKLELAESRGDVKAFVRMHNMAGNSKWREPAKTFRLDGKLDEPFWTAYFHGGGVVETRTGRRPKAPTRFYLKWYKSALHVGVRCEEPSTDELGAAAEQNGPKLLAGDYVTVLLETNFEARYEIAVSPTGAVYDRSFGEIGARWESQAEVATRVGPDFWGVEARIPVMERNTDPLHVVTGRMPTRSFPWHFNICRQRVAGGHGELSAWSPTGSADLRDPMKFGKLFTRHSR